MKYNFTNPTLNVNCKNSLPFVFTALFLIGFNFIGLSQSVVEQQQPASGATSIINVNAWSYEVSFIAPAQWGFILHNKQIDETDFTQKFTEILGMERVKGFSSENLAKKVADFIITKLKKEGYPLVKPITQDELNKAGLAIVILNPKN